MSAMVQPLYERNQEATCYVGNLDTKVNEEILWELFLQCGPVVNVHIPRDKITGDHQGYGFVELRSEEDADYSIKIMHMVKLFGKPVKVNKASQDKRTQEIGANLFVGNLHDEVDEKMLRDVFSAFGIVLSTKIMRDPETGLSKHYGFVSYDNFESSDSAISSMQGQYLCGKPIEVSYAYKKDTKGDRHGSAPERILAANRPNFIGGLYPNMISTATAYSNYLLQGDSMPMGSGKQSSGMIPAAPSHPPPGMEPRQMGGIPPPPMGQLSRPPMPGPPLGGMNGPGSNQIPGMGIGPININMNIGLPPLPGMGMPHHLNINPPQIPRISPMPPQIPRYPSPQ